MANAKSASWAVTGIWLALLAVAAVAVVGVLLFYVQDQKRVFDEFGLQLPWVTKTVIGVSEAARGTWWLLLPVLIAVPCAGTILLRHLPRRPTLGTIYAALSLTMLVVALVVVLFSIALPYQKLREGLSK